MRFYFVAQHTGCLMSCMDISNGAPFRIPHKGPPAGYASPPILHHLGRKLLIYSSDAGFQRTDDTFERSIYATGPSVSGVSPLPSGNRVHLNPVAGN